MAALPALNQRKKRDAACNLPQGCHVTLGWHLPLAVYAHIPAATTAAPASTMYVQAAAEPSGSSQLLLAAMNLQPNCHTSCQAMYFTTAKTEAATHTVRWTNWDTCKCCGLGNWHHINTPAAASCCTTQVVSQSCTEMDRYLAPADHHPATFFNRGKGPAMSSSILLYATPCSRTSHQADHQHHASMLHFCVSR